MIRKKSIPAFGAGVRVSRVAGVVRTAVCGALAVALGCGGRVEAGSGGRGAGGDETRPGSSPAGSGGVANGGRASRGEGGHAAGSSGGRGDDGGASGGGAARPPLPPGFPDSSSSLESLSVNQRRAVCLLDAERTDPCVIDGMRSGDPATCEQAVAACRAADDGRNRGEQCGDVIDLTGCRATVADYLACLDAWNPLFVCKNAGFQISTPPACQAVSECYRFQSAFMQLGRAAPCAPETHVPRPPDTDDDIRARVTCHPIPKRLVALGNSVAVCDETKPGCAPLALANYVRKQYSPDLTYENHAASNSDLVDLLREAKDVQGGSGHIAVWMFAFPAAPETKAFDLWQAQLGAVLDYFSDPSRFPDGATFLLNAQYSPSDRCPDAAAHPYSDPLTLDEEENLKSINQTLFLDLAMKRDDTVAIDQYPDWLGHGAEADVLGCPYCSDDNTPWLWDQVHPNEAGYEHIFEKWRVAVDRMYGDSCRR